ncbi:MULTISPECIES: VOC family protein [Amycolatopsis]|uniref:VOC family protein n=1 Tax=Amycolatopsis thermalba TaxID=944492 RepID=A0ABY4NSV6_9PSEU|nr:VOC family protein [Amycolatopsis thermalba]
MTIDCAEPYGLARKNRVHFDWMPDERSRDAEVARLLGLGARVHEDHRTPDGLGWVTLLDPEGNEFCIERSAGERQPA